MDPLSAIIQSVTRLAFNDSRHRCFSHYSSKFYHYTLYFAAGLCFCHKKARLQRALKEKYD